MRWFDLPHRLRQKVFSGHSWFFENIDEYKAMGSYLNTCDLLGQAPVWTNPNLNFTIPPNSLPMGRHIVPGLQPEPARQTAPRVRYQPLAAFDELDRMNRVESHLAAGACAEAGSWEALEALLGQDLAARVKATP